MAANSAAVGTAGASVHEHSNLEHVSLEQMLSKVLHDVIDENADDLHVVVDDSGNVHLRKHDSYTENLNEVLRDLMTPHPTTRCCGPEFTTTA